MRGCLATDVISRTFSIGIASTPWGRPKSMHRVMVSVNGRRIVKRVPRPASVSTSIVPLSAAIRVRTMSMPTPRPEMSDTRAAVLNPGWKMSSTSSRSPSASATSAATMPRWTAICRTRPVSMPPPSSSTVMKTLLPRCDAASRTVATSGLP